MKILSAIKAIVRQMLRDEFQTEGTDFADDELDIHINEALVEISQKRPYEVRETIESNGTKEIDLSAVEDFKTDGLLEVEKAEYPVGSDPPAYRNVNAFGNILRLDISATPTSGKDIYLYCHRVHQLTESLSTLSPDLENVLIKGVVAYTALAWCNHMRSQIVPASYRWHQNWANNQFLIYQNSLRGITKPRVWEFYPRG